jgi:hypothetical protein
MNKDTLTGTQQFTHLTRSHFSRQHHKQKIIYKHKIDSHKNTIDLQTHTRLTQNTTD